ncbi:hypothetical protein [Amycolatopsis sp. H20-H5]|nr:hypothetical protein [Amycolatopsis sp. H20-H5]MEC3977986.1 hypothetical protein [Amycolatopsis sp. H20-H5]
MQSPLSGGAWLGGDGVDEPVVPGVAVGAAEVEVADGATVSVLDAG